MWDENKVRIVDVAEALGFSTATLLGQNNSHFIEVVVNDPSGILCRFQKTQYESTVSFVYLGNFLLLFLRKGTVCYFCGKTIFGII